MSTLLSSDKRAQTESLLQAVRLACCGSHSKYDVGAETTELPESAIEMIESGESACIASHCCARARRCKLCSLRLPSEIAPLILQTCPLFRPEGSQHSRRSLRESPRCPSNWLRLPCSISKAASDAAKPRRRSTTLRHCCFERAHAVCLCAHAAAISAGSSNL